MLGRVRHVPALDEPRHLAARARRGELLRALAEAGAARDARRRADRQHDARARGDDRRRRARALDGAPARAARPPRQLPRDRAQRAAVPRLGDLRADRHRDRCGRAFGARVRVRGGLGVEADLRRARDRARAARAGRVRAAVRAQARDLGRARVDPLPRLVDPRPRRRLDAVGRAGPGRELLARGRPRDRALRLVDPARGRLHALLHDAPRGVLGRRHRLPAADPVPVRLRLDPRALAPRHRRADGRADHGRGGRHRQLPRAARADRGRDRRGVRERLLGRGVVAERADERAAAPADRRRGGDRDGPRARARPHRLPAVPPAPRRLLRAAVRRAARRLAAERRALRAGRRLPRARVPARDDRRLARRLRRLRVDRADAGSRLLDGLPRAAQPAASRASARRCRASRPRSRSPRRCRSRSRRVSQRRARAATA